MPDTIPVLETYDVTSMLSGQDMLSKGFYRTASLDMDWNTRNEPKGCERSNSNM